MTNKLSTVLENDNQYYVLPQLEYIPSQTMKNKLSTELENIK